jgi:hypothetical protein
LEAVVLLEVAVEDELPGGLLDLVLLLLHAADDADVDAGHDLGIGLHGLLDAEQPEMLLEGLEGFLDDLGFRGNGNVAPGKGGARLIRGGGLGGRDFLGRQGGGQECCMDEGFHASPPAPI